MLLWKEIMEVTGDVLKSFFSVPWEEREASMTGEMRERGLCQFAIWAAGGILSISPRICLEKIQYR